MSIKKIVVSDVHYIWLSHILSATTPAYAGNEGASIIADKQQCKGDSCNTVKLAFSNHLGSHVDAPHHFIENGDTVEHYSPSEWIFTKPLLIDLSVTDSAIINPEMIAPMLDNVQDADLVLFRTNFEQYRGLDRYWQLAPAFAPELASVLEQRFPSFSAIGMDTISISSYAHRKLGREAHIAFLSKGIRIFEDLALMNIPANYHLQEIIALPLRFTHADGAPCTILAKMAIAG